MVIEGTLLPEGVAKKKESLFNFVISKSLTVQK
jgi:hypothetical protein